MFQGHAQCMIILLVSYFASCIDALPAIEPYQQEHSSEALFPGPTQALKTGTTQVGLADHDSELIVQHEIGSSVQSAVAIGEANEDELVETGSRMSATAAERWLAEHNKYRCMHGAPDLVWSADVAASAQEWADAGVYKHSNCYSLEPPAGPAGENLAMGYGSLEAAAKAWYEEVGDCETLPGCSSGKNGAAVGHFTAMVWKGVKELGCGIGTTSGRPYYVCRYKAGDKLSYDTPNMRGAYTTNVLPVAKSESQCSSGSVPAATGTPTGTPSSSVSAPSAGIMASPICNLADGSRKTKFVQKCGNCVSSDQCQDGYCCPYMKKCVPSSSTGCGGGSTGWGMCRPTCHSKISDGKLTECPSCSNSKYPNQWVNCEKGDASGPSTSSDASTNKPTAVPTSTPTRQPTRVPSRSPTPHPTFDPTAVPSATPSTSPSEMPTMNPTFAADSKETGMPSVQPTQHPTFEPTSAPSSQSTTQPSKKTMPRPAVQPGSEGDSKAPTSVPATVPPGKKRVGCARFVIKTTLTKTEFSENVEKMRAEFAKLLKISRSRCKLAYAAPTETESVEQLQVSGADLLAAHLGIDLQAETADASVTVTVLSRQNLPASATEVSVSEASTAMQQLTSSDLEKVIGKPVEATAQLDPTVTSVTIDEAPAVAPPAEQPSSGMSGGAVALLVISVIAVTVVIVGVLLVKKRQRDRRAGFLYEQFAKQAAAAKSTRPSDRNRAQC